MKIIIFFFLFFMFLKADQSNNMTLNSYNEKKIIDKLIEEKNFNENLIIYLGTPNEVFDFIDKYKIDKYNKNAFYIFKCDVPKIGKNINYLTKLGLKFVFIPENEKVDTIFYTDKFFISNKQIIYKNNDNLLKFEHISKILNNYFENKWKKD